MKRSLAALNSLFLTSFILAGTFALVYAQPTTKEKIKELAFYLKWYAEATDPFFGTEDPDSYFNPDLPATVPAVPTEVEKEANSTPPAQFPAVNTELLPDALPLPQTDPFIGELGEAYVSFDSLPYKADKMLPGWRDFALNMSYEEVTNLINSAAYEWLTIKGSEEFFFIPSTEVFFVETYANNYFHAVQFLFDTNQQLYLIRLQPQETYFSFLELLKQLQSKYGKHDYLTARYTVWIGADNHYIELNRDRTIRYIRGGILAEVDKLATEAPLRRQSSIEEEKELFKANLLEGF